MSFWSSVRVGAGGAGGGVGVGVGVGGGVGVGAAVGAGVGVAVGAGVGVAVGPGVGVDVGMGSGGPLGESELEQPANKATTVRAGTAGATRVHRDTMPCCLMVLTSIAALQSQIPCHARKPGVGWVCRGIDRELVAASHRRSRNVGSGDQASSGVPRR